MHIRHTSEKTQRKDVELYGVRHLGDITKINWFEVEPVDVVTGGSPCQNLSVAGNRQGLAGEQSGLFLSKYDA